MKKNLISVVILALLLVNLILTTIMMISILPQTNRVNDLISKVAAAIEIDMGDGVTADGETGGGGRDMSKVEAHNVLVGETDTFTINLKKSEGDKVEHYAVVKVTLNIDTEHKDYGTYGTSEFLTSQGNVIMSNVTSIIESHTVEEMRANKSAVQDEITEGLNSYYNSGFIVSVSITATYQ
jgi:flagellar FliL protein